MGQNLFREKSIERISSPEQLNDYLHVTTPGVWVVLLAIIFLLGSFLFWCSAIAVESYAVGEAVAQNGVLTITFNDESSAQYVEAGMKIQIGEMKVPVVSVGKDTEGKTIAVANSDMPDGSYEVKVGYNESQILEILFN